MSSTADFSVSSLHLDLRQSSQSILQNLGQCHVKLTLVLTQLLLYKWLIMIPFFAGGGGGGWGGLTLLLADFNPPAPQCYLNIFVSPAFFKKNFILRAVE